MVVMYLPDMDSFPPGTKVSLSSTFYKKEKEKNVRQGVIENFILK